MNINTNSYKYNIINNFITFTPLSLIYKNDNLININLENIFKKLKINDIEIIFHNTNLENLTLTIDDNIYFEIEKKKCKNYILKKYSLKIKPGLISSVLNFKIQIDSLVIDILNQQQNINILSPNNYDIKSPNNYDIKSPNKKVLTIDINEYKNRIKNINTNFNNLKINNTESNNTELDNKKNYSINIITLVRNNKQYLKTSIGSLINQTNNNWYSIIINDGSNDFIKYDDFLDENEIKKYKNKIKIINNKDWKGIIKCQIIGIINSTCQIVGILDCDDKLDETTIEKVLNIYNNSQDENIFVYSNFYYCDENLIIINKGYARKINYSLLNDRCGNSFRTFFRKYYFLTSGYDDDLIFGAEDQDILFKIEEFCKPIFIDECLYYYRQNNKDLNNSISCLKRASIHSYYLSIFKNIMNRYGNIKCVLKIYNNIEDLEYLKNNRFFKESIIDNGIKYYFIVESNNINLIIVYDNQIINKYFNLFKFNKQKEFDVNYYWDYYENMLKISESDTNNFDLKNFSLMHPNSYFDQIYVINLKHEETKKTRITKIFDKYNIKCNFIEAIYGYEPMYEESYKKTKLKSPGVYGYSMSMIKIFNDAIKKGHNKILVCDDDIILHKNFDIKFNECIKSIPYSWKVLFFGLSGPWYFNSNTFLYNFDFSKIYTTNLISCDGSFCVGYDKTMYKKIIEITEKFLLAFDTELIKYLNMNLTIEKYAFYPQIVIADIVKKSTIINNQEEFNINSNIEKNHLRFMVNLDIFDLDSMENNMYNKLKIM